MLLLIFACSGTAKPEIKTNGNNNSSKYEKIVETKDPKAILLQKKQETLEKKPSENISYIIEEIYFVNASDVIVKDKDLWPPLEDWEVKFLPKEEAEYLAQRQKLVTDGMDSSNHQRLIPIFGRQKPKKGHKRGIVELWQIQTPNGVAAKFRIQLGTITHQMSEQ